MKNIFFIALFVCSAFTTVLAQQNPSKAVKYAFDKKFPNAIKVKWEKENDTEYEVEFLLNRIEYSANFSNKGIWLETEKSIKYTTLPEAVKNSFRETYKTEIVKDVAEIEMANGELKYEIEYKSGLKSKDVFYSKEGKSIE